MFNEFYHPQTAMKPSTTEYFRIESQGLPLSSITSQSGMGPIGSSLFSASPLFGLSSLGDQLGGLITNELSVSPSDFGFGLNPPSTKDICSVSPTLVSNSLLGSSLHNSVSRSYSDSSRKERAKNDHYLPSPIQMGWNGERESSSPFINSDPWSNLHPPLSLSKSHSEVFRTFSDRAFSDDDSSSIHGDNETSFLWSLKKASGNKNDYDTLLKNYNNKVLFALKLGYTESLLQKALTKLGLHAEENQILEELIKLQKSKPADGTNSPLSKQISDDRGSSSSVKIESGIESTESDLLPIVIDGSNVAVSHGNKERFSCKGIKICVDWFLARGHRDITVFVPLWRKETSKPDTPISDQHILLELEKDNLLSFTPSRQVSGRRFVCHDDRYILNLASETGAIVVSNDNYRELVNEKPEYKKVIEEKILMYTFVNDRFMPPDDPFGRNGPTLDMFLRRPKYGQNCNTQPCPYEKKCTYGNKCKFYHADRGNQPQKSITEKLKENSTKRINEVRARSPSNESGTGDQLIRTKSMQPMSSNDPSRFSTKKALARTKSLNPNLERSLLQQQQQQQQQQHQQQQQQHNIWPHIGNHFLDADRTTIPPVWSSQSNMVMMNPPKSESGSLSGFSVDTSRPPPMPQWGHPLESGNNAHRKLARQLTLNPTSDPRIHGRFIGESTDQFSYPPPTMIGNFSQQQQQHFAVKRNASAPEPSSQPRQHPSRSPVPNLVQIEGEKPDVFSVMHLPHHLTMQQQQQKQQQQNYGPWIERRPMQLPLQICSDMKLCKSKSE